MATLAAASNASAGQLLVSVILAECVFPIGNVNEEYCMSAVAPIRILRLLSEDGLLFSKSEFVVSLEDWRGF